MYPREVCIYCIILGLVSWYVSSYLCILRRDNVEVPLFVSDCIAKVTHRQGASFLQQTQSFYFRPSFITTDGLYRICGAHSDVQMIKQEIDKVLSSPPHPSYPSLWPLSDLRATLRSCLPLKVFTLWPALSNSSWGSFQSQSFLGRCSLKSRSTYLRFLLPI